MTRIDLVIDGEIVHTERREDQTMTYPGTPALITRKQFKRFLQELYDDEQRGLACQNLAQAALDSALAEIEPFKSWINAWNEGDED